MKFAKDSLNLTLSSNKLVILGLLIRLVPAAFTAHPTDMQAWKTIGSAIYNGQNPYTLPAFGLVYPPLWGLICSIAYAVYAPTQNSFVFNFVIKLPLIAVDMAMAKTIETIVLTKTKDQRTAREAMMLYLFNPMTIILSSFWGMFDAIPAFLVLLSMIFLNRKQYLKSSLALGVGIAFKGAYPALLLPLFLYTIIKTEGKGKTLGYLASSMLVPAIVSMPFVVADATSYVNMIITHNVQGQLSNLTYWLVIHSVFYQNQGIVSAISLVTFITAFSTLYAFVLRKADQKLITRTMILVILAFYLTSPTVNEQYIIWLLPPMIIYAATKKQRMKAYMYALTIIATVYAIANAGTAFFLPISSQLGQYQHLWPVMVICSLAFPVVSAAALRKTMKENETEAGAGKGVESVAPEVRTKVKTINTIILLEDSFRTLFYKLIYFGTNDFLARALGFYALEKNYEEKRKMETENGDVWKLSVVQPVCSENRIPLARGFDRGTTVSVLLPVYNEAEVVSGVLKAYHEEICRKMSAELIVAEDGSTDGTKEVLASLQNEIPIVLHSDPNRKGYAKAASDALKSCTSDWVFFSDSDGQYSPSDFWKLWKQRDNFDMVIGRKVRRSERAHRIVLAKGFHTLVNGLFALNLHDGDCGFRLIRKEVIQSIIDKVRFLDYSFWAEFTIRACLEGFRICEVPINHGSRVHGDTQIYKPSKIAIVVLKQLGGLARLYVDVRSDH